MKTMIYRAHKPVRASFFQNPWTFCGRSSSGKIKKLFFMKKTCHAICEAKKNEKRVFLNAFFMKCNILFVKQFCKFSTWRFQNNVFDGNVREQKDPCFWKANDLCTFYYGNLCLNVSCELQIWLPFSIFCWESDSRVLRSSKKEQIPCFYWSRSKQYCFDKYFAFC